MTILASMGKSLAQLVLINDQRLSPTVTDNLLESAPVVSMLAAQAASNGTDHKYLAYTTAPPVGFRLLNNGLAQGQSVDALVELSCVILDGSYALDTRAVANYTQGDLIQRENERHLRTLFSKMERQIFAGNAADDTGSSYADTAGFIGLVDNSANRLDTLSHAMVIGAGGTTADVQTSVYLLRSGEGDCSTVLGNDGNIMVAPPVRQQIAGDVTDSRFTAWTVEINTYAGFQWGGAYSASRIANVETGASVLNDDLIAQAISLHPADRKPNMICMNRDAERQLRQSRTATNATGAPAPFVESAFGIPVIVTDQISGDEAVVS